MDELHYKYRSCGAAIICEVCGELAILHEGAIPDGWMWLYYTPDIRRCKNFRFAGYLCPDHVQILTSASTSKEVAMETVWKAVKNHANLDLDFKYWLDESLEDIPESSFTAEDNPARWYICGRDEGVETDPLVWTEKRKKAGEVFLKEAEIFEDDCPDITIRPTRCGEIHQPPDMVNHPPHYTQGGIECIDAIEASMSAEEFAGYLKGNVMKYLWRYRNKGREKEDLSKAQWYLNKLTEKADKEQ